jgi:hypothetical protein
MAAEENIWVAEKGVKTCCDLSRNGELCNLVFKESDQMKKDEMDRPRNISGGGIGSGMYRVVIEIWSKEGVIV